MWARTQVSSPGLVCYHAFHSQNCLMSQYGGCGSSLCFQLPASKKAPSHHIHPSSSTHLVPASHLLPELILITANWQVGWGMQSTRLAKLPSEMCVFYC